MPELPEVEVVRRGLEPWVDGAAVTGVEVLDERALRRHPGGAPAFADELTGAVLDAPQRRGKYLWIPLAPSTGTTAATRRALVAHLGMSGQLLVRTQPAGPGPRHLRVRLGLRPAGELHFVDQRLFGGLFVDELLPAGDRPEELVPAGVRHIARDPLDRHFDLQALHRRLRARRTGLKRALLDQSLVSGIGNIYADEALWRARLHYARPTETINRSESGRLISAVRQVMTEALEQGGTSFDALYVNVNGASGRHGRSLAVYGLAGHPCKRCGTPIVRERFMNRSSHFCPVCQRKR